HQPILIPAGRKDQFLAPAAFADLDHLCGVGSPAVECAGDRDRSRGRMRELDSDGPWPIAVSVVFCFAFFHRFSLLFVNAIETPRGNGFGARLEPADENPLLGFDSTWEPSRDAQPGVYLSQQPRRVGSLIEHSSRLHGAIPIRMFAARGD